MISEILTKLNSEKLLKLQKICLFLAIALVPLSGPSLYSKSIFSSFSFYGQISSLPILLGLIVACISYFKEGKLRNILIPFFSFASIYMIIIVVISLHSINDFDSYTVKVLGTTPKIELVRYYLEQLGIVNEKLAYQIIVFIKDIRTGLSEVLFVFGFVAWSASLLLKEKKEIFSLVQKAVLVDFLILAFYVAIEIFHLYGCQEATEILKIINPFLYVPGGATGWYPPLVSWTQVRGTWTEPAYFSIWLAFAVPFLVYWISKKGETNLKTFIGRGVLYFLIFCVWFMTYARTSIYMAFAFLFFSLAIAICLNTKESRIHGMLLLSAFVLAFTVVSYFGPQDIGSRQQCKVDSKFIENTVKSSVSLDSRSTPTRVMYCIARLQVFMDSPLLGRGDSFEPWHESRKYIGFGQSLTPELKHRLNWINSKGVFNSGFGGNGLAVTTMLACRGIVGVLMYAIPISLFFFFLVKGIYRERKKEEKDCAICLFLSCSVSVMSAFIQGLWFFDFWCSCGVAIGWILCQRLEKRVENLLSHHE